MSNTNRFSTVLKEDIVGLIDKSKNLNTKRSTSTWIGVFRSWAELRGRTTEIEKLSPDELDETLQYFYAEIKKKNGKDYEPNSLCAMQAGLERYLKDQGYTESILTSRDFSSSRAVLEGKARHLREMGMGKRPNKAESLTREEEILWECGQFGSHSPNSIINTLWWTFTQHFGMRGRQEHHSMKIEDFELKFADGGKEFLTYSEGITKTRQSGLHEKHRLIIPKMFATGEARCPIKLFKLYLSKRPIHLRVSGPFYLATIEHPISDVWFKKSPMGENKINNIMKCMVENSPLAASGKKITNHSARKTVVKKLKQQQVPKCDIISITGHNTERGLDAYDDGDEQHQEMISNCIANKVNEKRNALQVVPCQNDNYSSVFDRRQVISPNDPRIQTPTFSFFSPWKPIVQQQPVYNFNNCTVNFNSSASQSHQQYANKLSCSPPRRKRIRFISSSDESSQEQ